MKRQNSKIILPRLLEGTLLFLLGLGIGLVLQSIFIDDRPWDKGATGGEELLPLRQTLGPSCGPTSLAMVARTWGIPLSEEEAVILARMTSQGTSMLNLLRAGRLIGLELVGIRLNHDELIKANKPVIAHIPPFHYVVIERATRQQVTIIDPASGRRRNIPSNQFARMWEGNCLVVIQKQPSPFISSFITDWQIAGPYPLNKNEPRQNRPSWVLGNNIQWRQRKYHAPSLGIFINLIEQFGRQEGTVAYAQTRVYSPVNQAVVFRVGSDDGIQIWLNGRSVWDNLKVERPCQLDQDIIPAVIISGWNHLLVQIVQAQGEWGFVFRITDAQGRVLDDLKIQ